MTTENMKKERFHQLGLPPMELAESSANNQNNNGVYKCFLSALLKVMLMLLLTILGAGTYVLLSNILDKYDNPRITRIILTQENSDPPDMSNYRRLISTKPEENGDVTRKKRGVIAPPDNAFEWDDFNSISFNDEQLQKAREIIMKHDILCNEEDKQGICKNLVTKLREITAKKAATKREEETSRITLEDSDVDINNKSKQSEAVPTDVAKREALPQSHLDNLLENVPVPFVPKNTTQHDQPHNCFLNFLKQYPRGKELFDPTAEYLTHHDVNYEQPLSPHGRFYSPVAHASYQQARSIDKPRPKIHPQDVDILMSILTQKSDMTATEHPANITREVSCPAGGVPCLSGDTCIDKNKWCDGNVDCADVSDEARCSCKSRVDKSRLCDGYFDCPFGEDEMGCYGCNANTFSCEDLDMNSQSTCFTNEQRCNGVADCPNHKDEVECNTLAPSLLKKPIFPISNTEGFLHRNFKGEWYAVCKNPYMWAHDVCRRETGHIIRPPFIQRVPIDPMLKMNYINADPGGLLQTSDICLNSSAIYVTCPDMLCGTRVQSTSQLLRENAAIENHLYGRNKRHFPTNHPYPLMFYGNRWQRNADDFSAKTNFGIKFDTLKTEDSFDKMRNKRTESRVVGGKPSQPAAWPWMVAMYRDGMFHCGGVVITHSWVVSAAHCVSKFWDHYYEVQVGMLRRFSYSPQEQSHKVTHVIVNQHYSQTDMKNDLSLLKVEPAIQFSRWVRPICLPNPDTAGPDWLWGPAAGTICTAVGWGATTEHGPDPDHMREVEVPIWEFCKHKEDRAGKEICAGLTEGGKDACQGDSGGPLLCRNPLNSQQWYMAGIVSHGDGCGRKDEPGVYTRVSLFVKWIRYHTSSNSLPIIQPMQDCPGFKCESGISKCLPNKRRCDRIVDCLDAEDEVNCEFTTTISPSPFLVPKSDFIDEIFASKEAKADSNTTTNNNKNDYTSTPSDLKTTTVKEEIMTSANNEDSKSRESEFAEISVEDHNKPDFEHASTVELSISKSADDSISDSEEHVTSDPDSTFSNESTPIARGDAESITMEHVSKPLESRSSILERLIEETTLTNIDTTTEQEEEKDSIVESVKTIRPIIMKTKYISTTEYISTTDIPESTIANTESNQLIITTTLNPTEHLLEDRDTKSDDDIIELFPSSGIPDQIGQSTKHIIEKKVMPTKNLNENTLPKKLPDFDDKSLQINKIEDIVSSEIQPAIQRRKYRIPKEFQCRSIYQVIPHHHRCDRKADCEDGTDELDCTCTDYLATFDEKLICDGFNDCADGHDESNCYTCSDDKFFCKQSQMCLPVKNVCDGKPHCPQGEDELDCFTLSNGKEIEYDIDERPIVNFEGYLTNKHHNDWHVVCDDKLTLEQQEQAATHICHYLGFSSAHNFYVKYINVKEDEIAKRSLASDRKKRNTIESMPVHFAYRQASEGNETVRRTIIKDAQVIQEQCVPNITKTCKSLYVLCDRSLFTDFGKIENVFLRNTENVHNHMWPWVAKIFIDGHYKCTGVLVNLSTVLVSDSCLWDTTLTHHYITVVLGSHRTLEPINGMYEQVYQVDAKKDMQRSRTILLHLKEPAHYSSFVKPMIVSTTFTYIDSNSTCVAIGQNGKNNTISINLQETRDNCHPSNRCFVRQSNESICPPNTTSNHHWAGIISCHSDQGWFPAASFVDSRGECGLGDHINATDIENLKNEISYFNGKKPLPVLVDKDYDDCEGIRCGRGRCIPLVRMCDGVRDCEDGNDESQNACEEKRSICTMDLYHSGCDCSVGQMKCRNGNCISKELFRDGNNDCGDGTDEPGQTTCLHYLKTIMPSRLCDGILHCHDRSDEDPMFCKCFAKKTYKCGSKSGVDYCVAPDMVCDGIRDCPNGEDENTCIGLNAPHGTPYGIGQVIVRSHGVWYSKCYPTQNHTKSELEAICAELGFVSGHAKQIHQTENFIEYQHNNFVLDSFNDIVLNNNTRIKMRNAGEPIAKPIYDQNLPICYPVFIECL